MNSISTTGIGWVATFIIAAVIVAIIFFLFKNFRRFIYGLIVIIPSAVAIWISRSVVNASNEGNNFPMYVLLGTLGGILCSIGIGYFIETKTKLVKEFEKSMK